MKVIRDDIWFYHQKGYSIVIPTNGFLRPDGKATMGRGLALQAKALFGKLEMALGNLIRQHGNNVFYFDKQRLIMFPTKDHWKSDSTIEILESSCKQLKKLIELRKIKVAMPKIGCGAGKLHWDKVRPIVEKYFGSIKDDSFIVVDNEQGDSITWRGKNTQNFKDDEPEKKDRVVAIDQATGKKYTADEFEEQLEKEKKQEKR